MAIQGFGNVAQPMAQFLIEKNVASIVATDISADAVKVADDMKARGTGSTTLDVSLVEMGDNSVLFDADADIVAPSAWGGILNDDTIPHIKAPIICGAANNMLLDPEGDAAIAKQGQTYVYTCTGGAEDRMTHEVRLQFTEYIM